MSTTATSSLMLSSILISLIVTITLNKSKNKATSKSNFECGFNSEMSFMNKFSSQYFSTAIIFLIFDMEVILVIPSLLEQQSNHNKMTTMMILVSFLTASLMVEWKEMNIEWSV